MGYVYVLFNSKSKLVKIGKTKNPYNRFNTLTNQNGTNMKYYLSPAMHIENIVEKVMHNRFDWYRKKGEWFDYDFDKIVNELEEICNSKDFQNRNFKR